jgi:hypothetical protein
MKFSGAEGVAFIAVIVLALIFGFFIYWRRREGRVRRLLLSRWGAESERPIGADELSNIRAQASALVGGAGFTVDDVTWNDLDMDKLYARMNTCFTDAGDYALYAMLRNPLADTVELERRSRAMAWAGERADVREKVKRLFFNLGRTGGMDFGAMFEREWFSRRNWLGCIVLAAALAASILLCILGFAWALVPLMAVALANILIHFRTRRFAGRYFSIYRCVPSVLSAANRLIAMKIPELDETNGRVAERQGRVRGILGNQMLNNYYGFNHQSINDPIEMLLSVFNVFFLLDVISLYNLSRHIFRYKNEILEIFSLLGEVDALIAAASFRETLGAWCEPEFEVGAGARSIRAKDLTHPLLRDAVPNDLDIARNVLLTGSNATGKSTFLKAVAMNAIFAQSLMTCAAAHWRSGFFRVYTSMALRDDLFGNESYFITEIKSLKRMMDAFDGGVPCLCIVDEVLRGTNTGERIAAASEALRRFSENNCLCLAATHDIELTYILEGLFENMHFSEEIRDGGIHFDYKLRPGRSTSRNAIKLLELLGYGGELVSAANARLGEFEKTGKWRA